MRIVKHDRQDAGFIVSKSDMSVRLENVYKASLELAKKQISDVKEVITEAYKYITKQEEPKSLEKINSDAIHNFFYKTAVSEDDTYRKILMNAFLIDYLKDVKDPIQLENQKALFEQLLVNTFAAIRSESGQVTGQMMPYIMFSAPLMRFMIPKLVANDIFSVVPMRGPYHRLYFFRYVQDGNQQAYPFSAYLTFNNSTGRLELGESLAQYGTNPGGSISVQLTGGVYTGNIISELRNANLIPQTGNFVVQPGRFKIVSIVVGSNVIPVTGSFNPATGVFYYQGTQGSNTYNVSGTLNLSNGQLVINAIGVDEVNIDAWVAYEYRNPARNVKLDLYPFDLTETRIEETLMISPEFIHDAKMLFDIDVQAEMVSILSSLVALNTDVFLLQFLYNSAASVGPNPTVETADSTVPGGNPFPTPKMWYEGEFIPKIFRLEGRLRKQTPAYEDMECILVMNTVDAQYIRSVDKFSAEVDDINVTVSRRVNGTLDKAIKIVTTPVLPEGENIMILKSNNPLFATAVYAPYVTQVVPYPANTLGPALTAVHRFAAVTPWPKAIGLFRVRSL